ncbi:MAG: hypothetical protein WCG80_07915 [Spirochaetales bacterium]
MNISSDLSSSVQKLAMQTPAPVEAGEGREAAPDNEAVEASPAKAPLRAYQGTKVDVTA